MIFETITLENLFSYYGKQVFDLKSPTEQRNIILINGRNGFGKTSFLNSLKLLFTGADYEPLRRAVQRQRMPSPQQYVTGVGDDWWGIMNRRAKTEGQKHCSVRIDWKEEQGNVTARRTWLIKQNTYEEQISIQADFLVDKLTDEEAQEFLEHRLSRDYVYLFLFDAEQIHEIAEANREVQQQQIERLLGIEALDVLRKNISSIIRKWEKEGLSLQAKAELERLEGEIRALNSEYEEAKKQKEELNLRLEENTVELSKLQRRIEKLAEFTHYHNKEKLNDEKIRLEAEKTQLLHKVIDVFPRDIVFLTNPTLAKNALTQLETILHSEASIETELLERLCKTLPRKLFDEPDFPDPDIKALQKSHYRHKLLTLLDVQKKNSDKPRNASFSPEPTIAALAKEQLSAYLYADAVRAERAEDLNKIQQIKVRLDEIKTNLVNVGALSSDERNRYERYKNNKDSIEKEIDTLKDKQRDNTNEFERIFREKIKKEDESKVLKTKLKEHQMNKRQIEMAEKFRSFFGEMKSRKKHSFKEKLEQGINQHFDVLMQSHGLVSHINVDEDFGLHYLDSNQRPIGMGNLSAGMKQLVATALLWALSEASNKLVPIVVDTPLARIDRANQDALLRNYYPYAGRQVIVLPTDSEIDQRKFSLIADHVYKIYQLENRDGEHTRPKEITASELFIEV